MYLKRARRAWIALLLLGALAFAHASVSTAACLMERGTVSDVLAAEPEAPCECGTSVSEFGPLYANRCLAHCTADLQLAGAAVAVVAGMARRAWLPVPRASRPARRSRSGDAPLADAIPKRIQLHSFLV